MIVRFEQKDPLDIRTSVGVGVNLPFSGNAVFNTTYTTKEAIKANLINYFLTNKGERYLNPLFGSDIRLLLFDNVSEDTIIELKARIISEIGTFFPRVKKTLFAPDILHMKHDNPSYSLSFKLLIVLRRIGLLFNFKYKSLSISFLSINERFIILYLLLIIEM